MSQRTDAYFGRHPGFVDEDGWARVSEILHSAAAEIQEELGASAGRLAGKRGIPITIGLLQVETPPRR